MMKSAFSVLMRRELRLLFSLKRFHPKKIDFLGLILSVVIALAIGVTFALVLYGVIVNYISVRFVGGEADSVQLLAREREFLTLIYAAAALIGVLFGVGRINKSISYSRENEILLRLPVTTREIFLSKLLSLYFYQTVFMAGMLLPVNVAFGVAAHQNLWFWFASALVCLLAPALPLLLASLLALPAKYLSDWLKKKYILLALGFVCLLGGAFTLYSRVLQLVEQLFVSGQIRYLFNERAVRGIGAFSRYAFPVNWQAGFVLGGNPGLEIPLSLLSAVLCGLLLFFSARKLFSGYLQRGDLRKYVFNRRRRGRVRSPFAALLYREFITVLRTPDSAFSFFATATVLPLMVYCCIGLLTQLMLRMIGVSFRFETALLIMGMFAVLTNTFCAGNISREGEMFAVVKTFPEPFRRTVLAKLVFCSSVNALSLAAACILLGGTGYLSVGECFAIFSIVLLLAVGENMMATRKDLNRPRFSESGEEGSRTASFVIVIGLLVSALLGVGALGLSFLLEVRMDLPFARAVVVCVLAAAAALYCAGCAWFLYHRLDERAADTTC